MSGIKKKNHITLTWDDLQFKSEALAARIHAQGIKYDSILAITRGGMFPAMIISQVLGIRKIDTFCAKLYDGENPGQMQVVKYPFPGFGNPSGTIIVDEIIATGSTMRMAGSLCRHALRVSLFCHQQATGHVDIYGELVEDHQWINFPWELTTRLQA